MGFAEHRPWLRALVQEWLGGWCGRANGSRNCRAVKELVASGSGRALSQAGAAACSFTQRWDPGQTPCPCLAEPAVMEAGTTHWF